MHLCMSVFFVFLYRCGTKLKLFWLGAALLNELLETGRTHIILVIFETKVIGELPLFVPRRVHLITITLRVSKKQTWRTCPRCF